MKSVEVFKVPSAVGDWEVSIGLTEAGQTEGLLSVDWVEKSNCTVMPESKLGKQIECMLTRYFKGEEVQFERIPLVYPTLNRGQSTLLHEVMTALKTIPRGETRSYQWIAEVVGRPKGMRAVGGALGRNPLPIILPCHRVLAKNQSLGGFMRGHCRGLAIKRYLLELEGHRF